MLERVGRVELSGVVDHDELDDDGGPDNYKGI